MAGQLDFTNECASGLGACEIGATFDRILTWKIDGVPVNLTGATARMQIRQKVSSPVILELNTTNTRIVLGGVAGTIQLKLSAEETSELAPGNFLYDLLINHGTEVDRLVEGKFHIVAGVTHDDV
jgi:hypothetical protein